MTRQEAWQILTEFTDKDSLVKHALAVEAAMRHYARHFDQNEGLWGVVGLLHDLDYQRWPEPPDHTRKGAEILRQRGVDEEIVSAVLSHAKWNQDQYPLDRPLRKTLFAVDEFCGFLTACALVRPQRLEGLKPSSVRKKLKQSSFAAAISREDISRGAEVLGIDLDEHIRHCVAALQPVADELGLARQGDRED